MSDMISQEEPAWVTRMANATESQGGYRCSAFESNSIAREWRSLKDEIKRLRAECYVLSNYVVEYGDHHYNCKCCRADGMQSECTCGWMNVYRDSRDRVRK